MLMRERQAKRRRGIYYLLEIAAYCYQHCIVFVRNMLAYNIIILGVYRVSGFFARGFVGG
jgi:hypothetical protein